MSSPNISPIKPVMSVPETPTSVRRPRLFRHSFSPMECSVNVLESSGIEVIGDALPDLSPIKGPEETSIGRVQKMDIDNGKFRNLKKFWVQMLACMHLGARGASRARESIYVLCNEHIVSW